MIIFHYGTATCKHKQLHNNNWLFDQGVWSIVCRWLQRQPKRGAKWVFCESSQSEFPLDRLESISLVLLLLLFCFLKLVFSRTKLSKVRTTRYSFSCLNHTSEISSKDNTCLLLISFPIQSVSLFGANKLRALFWTHLSSLSFQADCWTN